MICLHSSSIAAPQSRIYIATVLLTEWGEPMQVKRAAPIFIEVRVLPGSSRFFLAALTPHRFLCVSTMAENLRRRKGDGKALSNLSTGIDGVNIAMGAVPAKFGLGSVAAVLTKAEVISLPFRDEMIQAHT